MSYPPFIWNNPANIGWNIRDDMGLGVTGAVVTANLYRARDSEHPDTQPGSKVSSMSDIVLDDEGNGFYNAEVPASAIPGIDDDYTLVVDATMSGATIGHWEESTAVLAKAQKIPDLCTLEEVKDYLGIKDDDTTQDVRLKRTITACSADFLNRIRRPGIVPTSDYSELVRVTNWQTEERLKDIFVNNWPINFVTSVTINDLVLPQYDPDRPDLLGWLFDLDLPDEERQYLTLRGLYWPIFETWLSPRRPIYRPAPMRVQVVYNAGYATVPADITEAIIEWVGYKKGLRELQMHDQTEQWVQLGQFQQNNMIATSTLKVSELDMPESVARVISVYERPVCP